MSSEKQRPWFKINRQRSDERIFLFSTDRRETVCSYKDNDTRIKRQLRFVLGANGICDHRGSGGSDGTDAHFLARLVRGMVSGQSAARSRARGPNQIFANKWRTRERSPPTPTGGRRVSRNIVFALVANATR